MRGIRPLCAFGQGCGVRPVGRPAPPPPRTLSPLALDSPPPPTPPLPTRCLSPRPVSPHAPSPPAPSLPTPRLSPRSVSPHPFPSPSLSPPLPSPPLPLPLSSPPRSLRNVGSCGRLAGSRMTRAGCRAELPTECGVTAPPPCPQATDDPRMPRCSDTHDVMCAHHGHVCDERTAVRTSAQLRALRYSRTRIERALETGELIRLRRGVFATPSSCDDVRRAARAGGRLRASARLATSGSGR